MTSGSTRELLAMCAIAQHFGRPRTPTDQAWIESLFSHVKADRPHPDRITDPAVLRAELASVRHEYNTGACTPASATSPPTTNTRAAGRRSARPAATLCAKPAACASPTTARTARTPHDLAPGLLRGQVPRRPDQPHQPSAARPSSQDRQGRAPLAAQRLP
jgi:hypothetical protein